MTHKKFVGYAHPSSEAARELGKQKEGCHYVSLIKGMDRVLVKAFDHQANAIGFALRLPHEWDEWSMRDSELEKELCRVSQ